MDRKVQATLLFILAVFIFMIGTKYGSYILSYDEPKVGELVVQKQSEVVLDKEKPENVTPQKEKEIYIHITGAVKKPGLYKLDSQARVDDAIKLASPLPSADINALNLAEKLQDQQKIVVPIVGEALPETVVNLAPAKNTSSTSSATEKLININVATKEELDALPGIGPAYAERIIQYRTEQGPFEKAEDIQQVPGIGPKKYEDLKERITVN